MANKFSPVTDIPGHEDTCTNCGKLKAFHFLDGRCKVKQFTIHFSTGADMEGDGCLYVQLLDKRGNTVRYMSMKELEAVAEHLNHSLALGTVVREIVREHDDGE